MAYCQRDAAWADHALGNSSDTIGASGCLLTSMADLHTWAGHAITPPDLNGVFLSGGEFVDCGGALECLTDDALARAYGDFWTLEEVYHCESIACDQNKLNNDDPSLYVIVELSGGALGSGTHFSPVTNWRNWTIADAWVGYERSISAWGGDPASLVQKVLRYRYGGGGAAPAPAPGTFVGTVDADGGAYTHTDASTSASTRKRLLPKGQALTFDRSCHAETVSDAVLNTPDDRWFHLADGSDEWIASAVVAGNPTADVPVVAAPGVAQGTFTVAATGGAHIRQAPDVSAAVKRNVADGGESLVVTASTHGGPPIPDNYGGPATNEWFQLQEGGWIASGVVKGEPPAGWQHEIPYPAPAPHPNPAPAPTPAPSPSGPPLMTSYRDAAATWKGPIENMTPDRRERLNPADPNSDNNGPSYDLKAAGLVVIHTMDGTADGADARFKNPSATQPGGQASAHYGVRLDGSLWQWVDEKDAAWHAGNWEVNRRSIGIEHEDGGRPNDLRPDALYAASAKLVADICHRYGWPVDTDHVKPHHEVSIAPTACPDALDVARVVRQAKALLPATPAPQAPTPPTPVPPPVHTTPTPTPAPAPLPPTHPAAPPEDWFQAFLEWLRTRLHA